MSNYVVAWPQAAFHAGGEDVVVKQGERVPDGVPIDQIEMLALVGVIVFALPTEGAEPAPPASASQAVWAAYAVSRGADEDEANAMKKDDLVAKYGPKQA